MNKILIVDDDPLMLRVVEHGLTKEGYKVFVAEDGFKAMNILQNEEIALIISDIMMPNLSGVGFLKLAEQLNKNKIPVIIISSLDKADIILSAIGIEAVDFIVKPIDFAELSSRIKSHLNKPELYYERDKLVQRVIDN